MKTDAQLKKDIGDELEWDPSINASHVGIAVEDGVVTLTGHLNTYSEKAAIERLVERVKGVKAIAVEIDVKLDPGHQRSDSEIAAAAEAALRWHSLIPSDRIQVKVEKGWLTLNGELDWDYQRESAASAVRNLTGVLGMTNTIRLKLQPLPDGIARRIRDAFARHAEREARHIDIDVYGGVVTLRGKVDSLAERNAAFGAAWAAPGVVSVIDQLEVAA